MHFLKRSLVDVENLANLARNSLLACSNCKGKTKLDESMFDETKLDVIMSKLDSISSSSEAKYVPQTLFVKARPSLGFNENESNSRDPQDKLVKELTEKVHRSEERRVGKECRL